MIDPNNFAIHVTYTCPLTCKHCCFSSSPTRKEALSIDHIINTIEALDPKHIKIVSFTGGEPFLLGSHLTTIVSKASECGFKIRIVTSAYFGKHHFIAEKRLSELVNHGLYELTISWDDYHEEFVPFEYVYNVFWIAKKLNLKVTINMVRGLNTTWTRERLLRELGVSQSSTDTILISDLNLTGRAEVELVNEAPYPKSNGNVGPCSYVLTGPTLSARNKLLACCGVIQETEQLTLKHDFHPDELESLLKESSTNPLLNWLHLYGPYHLIEMICNQQDIPIPEFINGNCEACRVLFHTPDIAQHIKKVVEEHGSIILNEAMLLRQLNWM